MELKIKVNEKKVGTLEKVTFVLFGVFLTSLIFAFGTKYLAEIGMWLSLVVCAFLIFAGFYYVEKGTKLRLVTWGMLGTIIFVGIVLIIGINYLTDSLDSF